jgi:excisionase family DNA binding protein
MVRKELTDTLLSRREAAEYLGIKVQTLATWTSSKRYQLPVVKVGRSVRYRTSDLEKWMADRTEV